MNEINAIHRLIKTTMVWYGKTWYVAISSVMLLNV